jgi:hypothetical protein
MKRRVLEKLNITEISGVDRPCQEGARVAIMKRDFSEKHRIDKLEKRIDGIRKNVEFSAALIKFWSEQAREAAIEARRRKGKLIARTARAQAREDANDQPKMPKKGTDDYYAWLERKRGVPKSKRHFGNYF